jgi:hypothetical protein
MSTSPAVAASFIAALNSLMNEGFLLNYDYITSTYHNEVRSIHRPIIIIIIIHIRFCCKKIINSIHQSHQ